MRNASKPRSAAFAALCVWGCLAAGAVAGPVNLVSPGTLTTNSFEGFTSLGNTTTVHNSVLSFTGIHFGERFSGQTVSPSGNFDAIGGTPSSPLIVIAGAAGQNLVSGNFVGSGPTLTGLSHLGNTANGIGEGAFAFRFDTLQSEFGFQTVGADNGTMTMVFFRADGSTIDSMLVPLGLGSTDHGFRREGGVADIAGILITNSNGGGIAFDNFYYDNVVIPLPSAGLAAFAGVMFVGVRRRRA